jgi:cyclophilin family peptidyl-prolyl cis-trans isomerase
MSFLKVQFNLVLRALGPFIPQRGLKRLVSRALINSILGLIALATISYADQNPPFALPKQAELNKIRSAIIYTEHGQMKFELFPDKAPWHVANFKYLADKGFYKNLVFHRYQRDYYLQGGSPDGQVRSGPGWTLPPEFSDLEHTLGTLGMARMPDYANPERRSNGSQFHILLRDAPFMDQKYTAFGRLVSGMEVLDQLGKGDRIKDIKVFVRQNLAEE